ncbi:MAG: ArsJ-associated glyceraldehyde-3-phosphate dehydrogenase [Magnetococcales bacterium]|nr:ArsJ-associated glyceraldehyde-3-phosphate dehydrogenase [Magnetococcales bacterium]
MSIRIGINGFGRMGRLGFRAAFGSKDFEVVHINELKADARCSAHLLKYDSVHGIFNHDVSGSGDSITVNGNKISYSSEAKPGDVNWAAMGIDMVLDCSGKFKSQEALQPYFDQGIKKVVVSAPVKDGGLNLVMGINDHLYNPEQHNIITPASCTTNCLAPVVKVMLDNIGIKHASMTTIHDITNTQTIIDLGHKDLRRARACSMSLIPTTSGSAKAIIQIFPELAGKMNGMAVRVPLLNASLTDMVFEVPRATSVEEINAMMKSAAEGPLKGILGYEELPLVSIDYKDDPRSSIVDALSTMVINETQVKILAWYDNEWGYSCRMMELVGKVARSIS